MNTPHEVVKTFWAVVRNYRVHVSSVIDLGAGDGRFAVGGNFNSYTGIEIDATRTVAKNLPENASVIHDCAFRNQDDGFSACVGNPPYVRHHDLEPDWRDRIAATISDSSGCELNRKCNLYVYFLFLALFKTTDRGLVASIVPYEWLSRPSSKPLRDYIHKNRWQVDAYRFKHPVFDGVETTTSISIIDKRVTTDRWRFFSIDCDGTISAATCVTGTRKKIITYDTRGDLWAMRGMSPGTQKVFTLTEGERIHAGLTKHDVYPCVTSLRHLPAALKTITPSVFAKRYVDAGQNCWLIRSDKDRISNRLRRYLDHIPHAMRDTSTCTERDLWYQYKLAPIPNVLVSSGFVGKSTKAVANSIQAHAIGSVHGVHDVPEGLLRKLQHYLARTDFAARLVAHSGRLRKLEVRQLNAVLNEFTENFA